MIQFTKSFKTDDGQVFGTIEEAQIHEICQIFKSVTFGAVGPGPTRPIDIAKLVLEKKDAIIDILTTTANSKPKARSINGGSKKRRTVITAAPSSVASTNNT